MPIFSLASGVVKFLVIFWFFIKETRQNISSVHAATCQQKQAAYLCNLAMDLELCCYSKFQKLCKNFTPKSCGQILPKVFSAKASSPPEKEVERLSTFWVFLWKHLRFLREWMRKYSFTVCAFKGLDIFWLISIWPRGIWPRNILMTGILITSILMTGIWPTCIWPIGIWSTRI